MRIGVIRAERPHRSTFEDVVEDGLDSRDTATDDDQGSFNAVEQGGQIGKRKWESWLLTTPRRRFRMSPLQDVSLRIRKVEITHR